MSVRPTKTFAVIAVLSVAMLAACGGGDSKLKTAVQDAVYASGRAEDAPFELSRKVAGCVADALLQDKSIAKDLQTAYDDGKDLLDAVGDDKASFTIVVGCVPKSDLLAMILEQFTSDPPQHKSVIDCLETRLNKINEKDVREMIIGLYENDTTTDAYAELTASMIKCKVETGPSEADVKDALTAALIEVNQSDPNSPFAIAQSEAQCVANGLLDDSGLKSLATDAVKAGKTGKALFDALDAGQATTEITINCLSKARLLESFALGLNNSGATEGQINCLHSELDSSLSQDEVRELFLDIQSENPSSGPYTTMQQALVTCGLA